MRRVLRSIVPALLVVMSGSGGHVTDAAEPEAGWKVGAAKVVITPAEPIWMAGYAGRKGPSEGVLLDLQAKAMSLADAEGHRLVIVTLDLISIPSALREAVLSRAKTQHGLQPHEILLNVSHTHCGPMLSPRTVKNWGLDPQWTDKIAAYAVRLEKNIVDVIGRALSEAQPARLGYSHARCGFAMNRRLPTEKGYQNSPYPEGPVDHDVPVLKAETAEGKLIAVLFGYACHNTTLGIQQLNGDYAGFAQRDLEADHPGTVAMFLMGCGGDQNPYPRGKVEQAEQHGRSLANAVEAALLPAAVPLQGHLASSLEMCPLGFAPPPGLEELQQRVKLPNGFEARHAASVIELLKLHDGKLPEYEFPVQVVRLGRKLTLVALGDETVIDFTLRTKRELAKDGEIVWVAGYSNLVTCYVPSRRVLQEGGYEAGGAMIYTSQPGPFAEDVEDRIMRAIHQQAEAVRKQGQTNP